jgi:hypothetical protein
VGGLHVAKDVGVSPNQFVADTRIDIVQIEVARALGEGGVEDNLEAEVAEFRTKFSHITLIDRFADFVDLLDGVGLEGLMALLAIPRAALGGEKRFHDLLKAAEGIGMIRDGKGHDEVSERV